MASAARRVRDKTASRRGEDVAADPGDHLRWSGRRRKPERVPLTFAFTPLPIGSDWQVVKKRPSGLTAFSEAQLRTRTGDPFLTMIVLPLWAQARTACKVRQIACT